MKKLHFLMLFFFLFYSLYGQEDKISVAIFTLENKSGIEKEQAEQITNYLSRSITNNPIFNVVEREKIKKVFEEQSFQLSGVVDENQIVEYGKLLAAEQLLMDPLENYLVKL